MSTTPNFNINRPLIEASNRKAMDALLFTIQVQGGRIANWHDDVTHAKAMEERARVSHMALNEARDGRRNGTS